MTKRDERKKYPYKKNSPAWERAAVNLMACYAPTIYACSQCGAPRAQGYCCAHCGSGD